MLVEGSLGSPASMVRIQEAEVEGARPESLVRCYKHFALLALLSIGRLYH